MSLEIEKVIKMGLKRLINEITRNGQLSRFENHLQLRRRYDQIERQYIQNQRLRKELGNQYESSDSQQEKQNIFINLSPVELKKIMRKALIQKNFDEQVLEPIKQNQKNQARSVEYLTTTKLIGEDVESRDFNPTTQLNIIKEVKEAVEEQIQKETNFGLEFLIYELQRIQKLGAEKYLQAQDFI